jgi:hypothetical protein
MNAIKCPKALVEKGRELWIGSYVVMRAFSKGWDEEFWGKLEQEFKYMLEYPDQTYCKLPFQTE